MKTSIIPLRDANPEAQISQATCPRSHRQRVMAQLGSEPRSFQLQSQRSLQEAHSRWKIRGVLPHEQNVTENGLHFNMQAGSTWGSGRTTSKKKKKERNRKEFLTDADCQGGDAPTSSRAVAQPSGHVPARSSTKSITVLHRSIQNSKGMLPLRPSPVISACRSELYHR